MKLNEEAKEFYNKALDSYPYGNDYETALIYFKKAAELGHADAMYYLGELYSMGKSTDKNSIEANKYYEQAAKLLEKDFDKWYKQAFSGCVFLEFGTNTSSDIFCGYNENANFEHDYNNVAEHLAEMYTYGKGISVDDEKALKYYMADKNYLNNYSEKKIDEVEAMRQIGGDCYDNDEVTKAINWYEKAADFGDFKSMKKLAEIYLEDNRIKSTESSKTKAMQWYEQAAAFGDTAQYMDIMVKIGDMLRQEPEKAIEYYKKAADLGDPIALNKIDEISDN